MMKMKKVLCAVMVGLAALAAGQGYAATTTLEPVIVTATRVEIPLGEVGSSVTLITREEIESQQAVHLLDVLRSVPGLDVARSGGLGQQASVFLRGANSAHTLVLVDGIEVNDPSDSGRSFDFAALPAENIDRIEIVRGSGSALYGSDAMGGVINIITRKGSGKPQFSLSAEGGSFKTHQEKFSVSGGTERVNYSVSGSSHISDGISAASKESGNSERDGYDRKSLSARLGLTPTDTLDIDFFYRYLDAEADLDNFGGPNGDDPNYTSDSRSTSFRAQAHLSLFDSFWEQTLGFSLTDNDRSYKNDTDVDHPLDSLRSQYDGQMSKVDWQHNLNLSQSNMLTIGAEYEEETTKSRYFSTSLWGDYVDEFSEKSAHTVGYYLQDQIWLGDNFVATGGLRIDDNSRFGTHDTYRVTASYSVPSTGTRFKATYGTGFKAPSLFQLFSSYGDIDLDPETSKGWDAGVEQSLWDERILLDATYFENDFKDLIDYDLVTSSFQNIGKAQTSGLELNLSIRPVDELTVSAGYTYTKTENLVTGEELLRRPRNKYNLNLNYRFLQRGDVNLNAIYVGKRTDFGNVPLAAYTVVNMAASYNVTENLRLTGRIENLFNADYEEVSGYGTPGIAGYLGMSLNF